MVLSYGCGLNSLALLALLRDAGMQPALIAMADTGGESGLTWRHVARVQALLASWGWPPITLCRHRTLSSTVYTTLQGNCVANATLPSLAYGKHSCSLYGDQ